MGGAISPDEILSKIHLGEDMKEKYPVGSVVELKSCDYPELHCSLTVAGYLAPDNCAIVSAATMALLHLQTSEFAGLEEVKAKAKTCFQAEFQPLDWTFMQGANKTNRFKRSLIDEHKILQQGAVIPYSYDSVRYEIVVKHCQPNGAQMTAETDCVFSPPPMPVAPKFTVLALNEEITVVCPADEYIYYHINVPADGAWLERDLVISLETLAGNVCAYVNQSNNNPTVFDHQWSSHDSVRITNTDPRVSYPVELICLGLRSTGRDGAVTVKARLELGSGPDLREVGRFSF